MKTIALKDLSPAQLGRLERDIREYKRKHADDFRNCREARIVVLEFQLAAALKVIRNTVKKVKKIRCNSQIGVHNLITEIVDDLEKTLAKNAQNPPCQPDFFTAANELRDDRDREFTEMIENLKKTGVTCPECQHPMFPVPGRDAMRCDECGHWEYTENEDP